MELLLLSSNLRRRYAEDVLTALALPRGSTIQFRYNADYVMPALQRSVADGRAVSADATVAFVADFETDQPFLVPVRFATVISATCVADIFSFKLRIGDYVDLDQYPWSRDEIVQRSKVLLEQMVTANSRYYPAVSTVPDMNVRAAVDAPAQWLGAARRLSLHPTFADSYFLRIDPPTTQAEEILSFNRDGRLEVVDRQSVRVLTNFYSEKYEPSAMPKLSCLTDGTFLRVSSDEVYDVALRYDSVEFWLHPAAQNFDTLSQVSISLVGTVPSQVPAYARLPVVVRRSKSRLAFRVLAAGGGALLVALPAILGSGSPLSLRIVSGLLGAVLLAYTSTVLSSAR